MRAVALKKLQDNLSEYVHLAEDGETVLVTERDRVIARLVPPLEERRAGLAEAIRKGWVTLPVRRENPGPPPRIPAIGWTDLARELDEDRGER